MPEPKPDTTADGKLTGRHALLAAVVSTLIAGAGGPLLLVKFGGSHVLAPDRFTATDAKPLIRQVEQNTAAIAKASGMQVDHLLNHPDRALELALTEANAQLRALLDNQKRIEKRLDKIDKALEGR